MTPKEIEGIEQAMHMRHLKKNAILRFPKMLHKYVYLLKEGVIKIALMNEDGKEFIKYLIKPGGFDKIIVVLSVSNDSTRIFPYEIRNNYVSR